MARRDRVKEINFEDLDIRPFLNIPLGFLIVVLTDTIDIRA